MAVVSPQVDCCACSTGNRSITWQSHCVCFASGFSVTAGLRLNAVHGVSQDAFWLE